MTSKKKRSVTREEDSTKKSRVARMKRKEIIKKKRKRGVQEQTTTTYVKMPTAKNLAVAQYQKMQTLRSGTLENQHTDANTTVLCYGTKKD